MTADQPHTQLLADLLLATEPFRPGTKIPARAANFAQAALRAVVELHAPVEDRIGDRLVRFECQGCDTGGGYDWYWADWPCSTIRAIADQLGLTEGTDRG